MVITKVLANMRRDGGGGRPLAGFWNCGGCDWQCSRRQWMPYVRLGHSTWSDRRLDSGGLAVAAACSRHRSGAWRALQWRGTALPLLPFSKFPPPRRFVGTASVKVQAPAKSPQPLKLPRHRTTNMFGGLTQFLPTQNSAENATCNGNIEKWFRKAGTIFRPVECSPRANH